jgi:hypothetical protein
VPFPPSSPPYPSLPSGNLDCRLALIIKPLSNTPPNETTLIPLVKTASTIKYNFYSEDYHNRHVIETGAMKAFCSREVPGTVEINVKKWAERKPCVITAIVIVEVFVSCIILREEPGWLSQYSV